MTILEKTGTVAFAHELSHISEGHLDAANKKNIALDQFGASASGYSFDWDDEFEADLEALEILEEVGGNSRYLSIYMFMLTLELFEKTNAIFYPNESTHPPAKQRLERLIPIIGSPENWPESSVDFVNGFKRACKGALNEL